MTQLNSPVATVVLVHAAWADASSWNKVIPSLQRKGLEVVAAQIPLTSLSDDAATLRRFLKRVSGPVVLVGHSYGGAVITAAGSGDPNVKALVYIAAMAPDKGETVHELLHRAAPHPSAPALVPDEDGFLWMSAMVAERDRMIAPETQRFMADRIGGRVYAMEVDHTPLASAPDGVVAIITEAVDAVAHDGRSDARRINGCA